MGAPRGRRAAAEQKSKQPSDESVVVQTDENTSAIRTPVKSQAGAEQTEGGVEEPRRRAALSNITNNTASKTPFKTPLKGVHTKVDSGAKINALLEELEVEINGQCKEMEQYAQVPIQSMHVVAVVTLECFRSKPDRGRVSPTRWRRISESSSCRSPRKSEP